MNDKENGVPSEPDLQQLTGGEAGDAGDNPLSPDDAEPGINKQCNSPYKGSLAYYLSWGGGIGAVGGCLIALAANFNWFGGLVAGAVTGAAIGLYVVETRGF